MGQAEVAEAVWDYQVDRSAFLRLRNGLPVERLLTGSLAEAEEDARFARAQLAALDADASTAETVDDFLNRRFLQAVLEETVDADRSWWWSFSVTPYGLYPLNVEARQAAASLGADNDRQGTLAADYAAAVRTAHEKWRLQAEAGWRLPRPAYPGAIATMEGMRAAAPSLWGAFADETITALDGLLADLVAAESDAPDGVGLGQFPHGDEAYASLLRRHATYDVTIDGVHATGLAEVAWLTEELEATRRAMGFTGSEAEFRKKLEADGRLYATSPDDVESRYRAAIARIEPRLADVFARLPAAPYDIARLEPAMEPGMTYGYYEPPSDVVPIGRYRYNGSGLETRSQVNAAAIIYHELIPGHHFQIARQKENTALQPIRRDSIAFAAFNEGWAEWAAALADDLQMYNDPVDRYGWLIHQRFTAQRLVVDTGLNALGWSLEKGREYMAAMTYESPGQVATETLRYSTDLPGQAVAYRLGYLKFRELRERSRAAIPDIRDYHELVLAPGGLPLSVVAEHIDRQIAART